MYVSSCDPERKIVGYDEILPIIFESIDRFEPKEIIPLEGNIREKCLIPPIIYRIIIED